MKILHVITSLGMGGAEKLMVDLLPRLNGMDGNEVELCVFCGKRHPFYDQLEIAGVKIYSFGQKFDIYHPRHLFHLVKLMRNYDIVHTHNTAPQLFAALGSMLCSAVLCTTEHNTSNRRRRWKWYAYIDKLMYSRYSRIICISQKAEDKLRAHIHSTSEKICTIQNGVDIQKFINADKSDEILEKFKDKHTAVMVAGFRWEKDQPTLIEAYRYLPDSYHLLLIGDGYKRGECEKLTITLKLKERVHFLGFRSDIPNILKSVDVVVMSSHFEGLSLSNIEGMASGNPFVASDVDGIRDVTAGYGVLFPHENPEKLAEEILKLTEDKRYRMAVIEKCQKRAGMFDINLMAENYNKVYRELNH